jgi:hypothetical protein
MPVPSSAATSRAKWVLPTPGGPSSSIGVISSASRLSWHSAILHPGVELDDRQQHRQHDQHHQPPMADDQQRLQDGGQRHRAALHLARAGGRRGSSICGSWPVCSPSRANIASRPGKRFLAASARPAVRLRAPAPARPARRRAWPGCPASRPRPAAPSGWARRHRPASPACRRSAPRCSRAPGGRPAAASGRASKRSRKASPRSASRKQAAAHGMAPAAPAQPQLRTKALRASIATVSPGQGALAAGEHLATCGTT